MALTFPNLQLLLYLTVPHAVSGVPSGGLCTVIVKSEFCHIPAIGGDCVIWTGSGWQVTNAELTTFCH